MYRFGHIWMPRVAMDGVKSTYCTPESNIFDRRHFIGRYICPLGQRGFLIRNSWDWWNLNYALYALSLKFTYSIFGVTNFAGTWSALRTYLLQMRGAFIKTCMKNCNSNSNMSLMPLIMVTRNGFNSYWQDSLHTLWELLIVTWLITDYSMIIYIRTLSLPTGIRLTIACS